MRKLKQLLAHSTNWAREYRRTMLKPPFGIGSQQSKAVHSHNALLAFY